MEASIATIPYSTLADLCRAGNEKTGSTRPGEASGMLSGQSFCDCWLAGFAAAMKQDFKRYDSERLTFVFLMICFGKELMEDFPNVFRDADGVRFAECCFKLGFFFWQNFHCCCLCHQTS